MKECLIMKCFELKITIIEPKCQYDRRDRNKRQCFRFENYFVYSNNKYFMLYGHHDYYYPP